MDVPWFLRELAKPRPISVIPSDVLDVNSDLAIALKPHQVQALSFFFENFAVKKHKFGILASKMGQGKTFAAIAFAAAVRKLHNNLPGLPLDAHYQMVSGSNVSHPYFARSTLWIVPNMQIAQLIKSIRTCSPNDTFEVYWDNRKTHAISQFGYADHIISTPHMEFPTNIINPTWGLVVIDESHLAECTRGAGHSRHRHLGQLRGDFKLLMTGSLFCHDSVQGIEKQLGIIGQTTLPLQCRHQQDLLERMREFTFRSETELPVPECLVELTLLDMTADEREYWQISRCFGVCEGPHMLGVPKPEIYEDQSDSWDNFSCPKTKFMLAPAILTQEYADLFAFGAKKKAIYDSFTQTPTLQIYKILEKIVLGHSNERFVLFASAPDCYRMLSMLCLKNVRLFNGCSRTAATRQRQLRAFEDVYTGGGIYVTTYLFASTGLNMTGALNASRGVSHLIALDPPTKLADLEQAVSRVYRQGNPAPQVTVHLLAYKNASSHYRYFNFKHRNESTIDALKRCLDTVPAYHRPSGVHEFTFHTRRVHAVALVSRQIDKSLLNIDQKQMDITDSDFTQPTRFFGMSRLKHMCIHCGRFVNTSKPIPFQYGCGLESERSTAVREVYQSVCKALSAFHFCGCGPTSSYIERDSRHAGTGRPRPKP